MFTMIIATTRKGFMHVSTKLDVVHMSTHKTERGAIDAADKLKAALEAAHGYTTMTVYRSDGVWVRCSSMTAEDGSYYTTKNYELRKARGTQDRMQAIDALPMSYDEALADYSTL